MTKLEQQLIKLFDDKVLFDVKMSDFSTSGLGGRVKYFYQAKDVLDFNKACQLAKDHNLFFFAFTSKDNFLVASTGYDQLLIYLPDNLKKEKNIKLFKSLSLDKNIQKIITHERLEVLPNKILTPAIFLKHLGLTDKVFGGIRQLADNPNVAENFNQGSLDDLVIMSSYLKQQVRDKLGLQFYDHYQIIS